MTTEIKRDLAADLAFANECQRTESGLTTWNRESYDRATHAIRRAIAAEAEVERLREALEKAQYHLYRQQYMSATDTVDSALEVAA